MKRIDDAKLKKWSFLFLIGYTIIFYGMLFVTGGLSRNSQLFMSDIFILAGDLSAILIISYNILTYQKKELIEWIFFLFGIVFCMVGDIIWFLYDNLWHIEVGTISESDIFYIPAAIMFLIGMHFYMKKEKIFFALKTVLDISVALVAGGTIVYKYLLIPIWQEYVMSFEVKIFTILYPILVLGYLAGIVSILFHSKYNPFGKISKIFLLIGFNLFFISNVFFAFLNVDNRLLSYIYPIWNVSFLCIACASNYVKTDIVAENYGRKSQKNNWYAEMCGTIQFVSLYMLAGLIVILVSFKYLFKDPLVTGSVIVVFLILIRQMLSISENKKLLRMLQESNKLLEENRKDLEIKNLYLKELKEMKEIEARTDYLTNLYNRRYTSEWVTEYIEKYKEDEQVEFSMILMDIDHYKGINDTYGHDFGDEVLQQVAIIIRKCIRSGDMAGRYGGDEFMILLPATKSDYAYKIAERLLYEIHHKLFEGKPELKITFSIGNTYWQGSKKDFNLNDMIKNSDLALYEAKNKGRDRIISKQLVIL